MYELSYQQARLTLGKISTKPHSSMCTQFLHKKNHSKNNRLPLLLLCFRVVWSWEEILYNTQLTCSVELSSNSLSSSFISQLTDFKLFDLIEMKNFLFLVNPLTPRSDQHKTSPYSIYTFFSKQVMRRFKLIR